MASYCLLAAYPPQAPSGELKCQGQLPRQVEDILYLLKKKGNAAAHDNVGSLADVIFLLQSAFHLGKWLVSTYGVDAAVVPVEFMLPAQRDTHQELAQLAAGKDTLQQRVTELQATLAARPAFTTFLANPT